ncbi:MAG: serine/threonine-protein kinase [Bryobacteraceae bacterium]
MTPPRRDALSIALDLGTLTGPERDRFLREACRGDSALRSEVERLLEVDAAADRALRDAVAGEAAHAASPRSIGPYRIEKALGAGGMGAVYLAVRDDDEYEKRVAVKVMRASLAGAGALVRFRHERQILATLEHPHIARLLDGGTTAGGEPYIVMEYIEGVSLAHYVARETPQPRALLRLFVTIAGAVDYAHRRLIVHCDLKPSNILIAPGGEPKLLDFGIARVLTAEGGEAWTRTPALTPDYSSPEQKAGEPVTVAADVYSLGVVLREMFALLTEHGVGAPREVGAIVRKALEPEPRDRYASVADLAADIERFLDNRPVKARRTPATRRAQLFLRRHRGAAAAVALMLVTSGIGWWTTAREAHRAQHRFAQVRQMANAMLFDLHDRIRDLPQSTAARASLIETAKTYLATLEPDAADDRQLAAELATAYERLGDVQGGSEIANLGRPGAAAESYRKALGLREKLSDGAEAAPLRDLARVRVRLAGALTTAGSSGEGYGLLQAAIGDVAAARTLDPGAPVAGLIEAHHKLADWLLRRGRAAEAVPVARSAFEAARDAGGPRAAWLAHLKLGETLHQSALLAEANQLYASAGNLLDRDPQASPRDRVIAEWLQGNVAGNPFYPNLGHAATAEKHYRRALALAEGRLAADTDNAGAKSDTAVAFSKLAASIWDKDPAEAVGLYGRAIAIREDQLRTAPENVDAIRILAYDLAGSAGALRRAGHAAEAERRARRALILDAEMVRRDPVRVECCSDVPLYSMQLGDALWDLGRKADAGAAYRSGLEVAERYGRRETCGIFCTRDWADSLLRLARWSAAMGDQADARRWAEQSADVWRAWAVRNRSGQYVQEKLAEAGSFAR